MIRSRLGLKALGLCAMLVGMLAFSSVAHAEKGAFWTVAGKQATEALLPTVLAQVDVIGSLLTTLGGKEIHLKCEVIELVSAHLVEPLGKILGKIKFSKCDFLSLNGTTLVLQTACKPKEGVVETNNITGLIKLHEGQAVIEAVPTEAGGLFADIFLGEECAFGEHLKIGGVFFLKDANNEASVEKKTHLVEELKALTKLNVNGGATAAFVNGSATASLGGAHKEMLFAAKPA